ncbi:MAG: hypothetical protein IIB65_13490 [Proteobacteria bacterium]|nr:hypothetical protein [Pseudomonadota bacterium]
MFEDYSDDFHEISDMMNRGAYERRFVSMWLKEMPSALAALEKGGRALDFGTGAGRVPINLSKAFPNSACIGVDSHEGSIAMARRLPELGAAELRRLNPALPTGTLTPDRADGKGIFDYGLG